MEYGLGDRELKRLRDLKGSSLIERFKRTPKGYRYGLETAEICRATKNLKDENDCYKWCDGIGGRECGCHLCYTLIPTIDALIEKGEL